MSACLFLPFVSRSNLWTKHFLSSTCSTGCKSSSLYQLPCLTVVDVKSSSGGRCWHLSTCGASPDLAGSKQRWKTGFQGVRYGVGRRCVDQGGFSACQAPFVFPRGKEGSGASVATLSTWVLQKDAQMFSTAPYSRTHHPQPHQSPPRTHSHEHRDGW